MSDIYNGHLYHGTDKRILMMSGQERSDRTRLCKQIADYSYSVLEMNDVVISPYSERQKQAKEVLKDIWCNVCNFGIIKYTGRKCNSPLYQYGYLFVSNNYDRAASYAKHSFIIGETEDMAYWLLQGAKRFDGFLTNASDEIKASLKEFENIIEEKREPIVVIFDGVRKNDIKEENGADIDWSDFGDKIPDDITKSLRIINDETYDLTAMEYRVVK